MSAGAGLPPAKGLLEARKMSEAEISFAPSETDSSTTLKKQDSQFPE